MHNRNYCCYRHFSQGKHELSCTHCYSHVALGVINRPHSTMSKGAIQATPPLQIRSKPFRIENRTHDYNEVEHKESLPNRLKQPRVYVQHLINKLEYRQPLLPIKHSDMNEYDVCINFFKKIGCSLPQKTKQCLLKEIKQFAILNSINVQTDSLLFFQKSEFKTFILQNFNKINEEQVQNIWKISFNELRFKQCISMQAFVYNFGKFYLQLQNYNNTFSSNALRQRAIDLRILLFDWYNNQICLKYNLRELQPEIEKIEKQLKIGNNQQKYCQFHFIVDKCRKSQAKLKFLADAFFALTDNKYLSSQKIKQCMTKKIEERAQRIQISRRIIKKYLETDQRNKQQQFYITNILQFCRGENYPQAEIREIMSWIQGIFDYLFFSLPAELNQSLTLNLETRRFQCTKILEVNAELIRRYDQYLECLYDEHVQICHHLSALLDEALSRMPHLEGPKKGILQCNYTAQTLLRYIKAVDLSVFYHLNRYITNYRERGDIKDEEQALNTIPKQEEVKKIMKGLFKFPEQSNTQSIEIENFEEKIGSSMIEQAIKHYNKIKQQPLLIQTTVNQQQNKNEPQLNNEDRDELTILLNCKQIRNENFEDLKISQYLDNSYNVYQCKHWIDVSRDTNETISAVQSLESRLFELLDFNL